MNQDEETNQLKPKIQDSHEMSGENLVTPYEQEAKDNRKKKIKWIIIGIVLTIVIVLAILLPMLLNKSSPDNPPTPPPPQPDWNQNVTIYNPYNTTMLLKLQTTIEGYLQAKEAYQPSQHLNAYHHLTSFVSTNLSSPHNLTTLPKAFPVGENNRFLSNLSYQFFMSGFHCAQLLITDPNNTRYSIPSETVNKKNIDYTMKLEMLGLSVFQDPFGFQFSDVRDSSNVYLHTNHSTLVFLDKFIQMDFQLPSQRLYGFGERTREFSLGEGTWTMWAHGKNNVYDDGLGGKSSYGVHPFVLVQSKKPGDYFGIYFRNSNAQSPIVRFNETTGTSTLSYITTGGQLEVYFFLHGSAKFIIQQYLQVVGMPNLPPIWSLGWHQSSGAYKTQDDVENMIDSYDEKELPLDVVYLGISSMDSFEDFTINKTAYPDLQQLASTLHENSRKIVPIIDGYLSAEDKFAKYYQLATIKEATIKTTINKGNGYNDNLISRTYPSKVAFLDWFSHRAQEVWEVGMNDLYTQVPYDGVWLDMNEATTFISGELSKEQLRQSSFEPEVPAESKSEFHRFLRYREDQNTTNNTDPRTAWYQTYLNQSTNSTYYLPFIPGYWYSGNLDNMSLSLNASHPANGLTEYDVHNLFGHQMAEHTYNYMVLNAGAGTFGLRPFILSRSTFSGTGRFASHWTGNNWRDWAYLNYSISAIMNFNMFGIPQTGADLCGSSGVGALNQELCARWIQLGTFYPLAKNHYSNDSTPSEPYRLSGNWFDTTKTAMHDRYQYVRLIYTCLFEASKFGNTCFDPLFYHFPDDQYTYLQVEHTFMVANAVKVSPILKAGVQENDLYQAYFPHGNWASLIEPGVTVQVNGGSLQNLRAKKSAQAHLKPGSIIPFQNNTDQSIKKIHDLRERPISLVINRDDNKIATGSILLDSGNSYIEMELDRYEYYTISYQSKTIQKRLVEGTHATQKGLIDEVIILNAADLSDTSFVCYFTPALDIVNMTAKYDPTIKALRLSFNKFIQYNQFRQINFGSASQGDLNLCSPNTYTYVIDQDKIPDLSTSSATFSAYNLGRVASNLTFNLQIINQRTVNIKWTINKPNYTPFEVPKDLINITKQQSEMPLNRFIKILNNPLRIIVRDANRTTISTLHEFLIDDHLNYYFQEVSSEAGDNFRGIMGLGERASTDLFYKDGVYSMWNRDIPLTNDDGKPPGKNEYGTHPFFMYKNTPQSWIGVYTNLAAAQDWYIKNDKTTGKVNVTMIGAGGLGDIYFIVDNTPGGVAASYLDLVGRPVLIPQWALGWHQCRWGYNSTNALRYVNGNFSKFNLPLDVQWSDIDYMNTYRDFTFDYQNFRDLGDFVNDLHGKNQKYVPILDAGIAMVGDSKYPAYEFGKEADVFIKVNDEILVGQVWPNDAAYPDWFNNNTSKWYNQELSYLQNSIKFDGIWEDMNEASNFCNGYCYDQSVNNPVQYKLRYTPTGRSLEDKSIPLDGYHANDALELDVHNLFGIKVVQSVHNWFQSQKKRTFIITRSSFAGVGKFGSKWGGDQFSEVYFMAQSVTSSMMMGIFGIPLFGSDICGFLGNTNPELCARWYVVGAFQTFSRNHNDYHSIPQEPYVFANQQYEKGISYTDIIRMAMRTKYCLIRYYYTHMFLLHLQGGEPFYRPLFFDFPEDYNTYSDFSNNVMLGPALKLSVLSNAIGVNSTNFYFPAGTWCNVFDPGEKCFKTDGVTQKRNSKAYDYYVHLRQGFIIPIQDAFNINAQTIYDLQAKPVDLHINPSPTPWAPSSWHASGVYINDDGESFNITGNYNQYTILADQIVKKSSGGLVIMIQIQTQVATNYKPISKASNCYEINKADRLGDITVYNAKASGSTGRFVAAVFFVDGSEWTKFIPSTYDALSDQLRVDFNGELCLSEIAFIELTKL